MKLHRLVVLILLGFTSTIVIKSTNDTIKIAALFGSYLLVNELDKTNEKI